MSSPATESVAPVPNELIGALASTFNDMGGPSHAKIDDAINAAGMAVPVNPGNKSKKVRAAFDGARPAQARALVEQLIHAIRDNGFYDLPAYETDLRRAQAAVALAGGTLSDQGFLTWGTATAPAAPTAIPTPSPTPPPVRAPAPAPPSATGTPAVTFVRPGTQRLALPTHDRLLSVLRRLPASLKPLVRDRRVDQEPLRMANEYDLQDAVEFALRLIYDDVRPEERGPSVAGGSTTPDFLLPEVQTAVEVKVTKPGRRNNQVRDEILVDSTTYLAHPRVNRLVFVVYDLAGTIDNPPGFERDLGEPINGHPRDTLVVEWPHGHP